MQLPGSMAETQEDLVAERTEAKPERIEEVMNFPGVNVVHQMSESDLASFFTMALKSRPFVSEISFSLGEEYEYEETQSRIPASSELHNMPYEKVARVLTIALTADPRTVGFRAAIETDAAGNFFSRIYIQHAKKLPKLPVINEETGEVEQEGDKEFNPKLKLVYRPA
ncbi:MAG: hypothetical protein DRN26_01545 [Thermoplasmata archaeon]|nr:MAG: hypothetical protein DRN26_01545 [Thermoplasmata archaeon]